MNAATTHNALSHKLLNATVLITSLGYLIDMFDLFLYNMLRVKSLTDLGYSGDALTQAGLMISNGQWGGILLGGIVFGILGDKFGRKKCLVVSILIYSLGSLASAAVQSAETYALARFVSGFGLAGELGLGLTLIAEKMSSQKRGYGAMIFISLGFFGVMLAALAAEFMYWRHAYVLGGVAGLVLMFARSRLHESGMFMTLNQKTNNFNSFKILLSEPKLRRQYLAAIFFVLPIVFVTQIVFSLAPEHARSLGISDAVEVHVVLAIGYMAYICGDFLSIYLSEKLRSRKRAGLAFLCWGVVILLTFIVLQPTSLQGFYVLNGLIGLSIGIWMVGCIWAAEMFGTNVRATVASTVPNFARGMTIVMNPIYAELKVLGSFHAMTIIGIIVFATAYLAWRQLPETYGRDLDYHH
jgi:MFS transporter, putative metabolite:H+ symporter